MESQDLPLSVVVPCRDRAELLNSCLASLRRSLSESDEVIVVDSASHGDAVRRVAVAHGARYMRAHRPGASRARNLGWRTASHPLIALVDDDVRVAADWADAIRVAGSASDAAFFTGRITVSPSQRGRDRPVAVMGETEPKLFDVTSVNGLGHGANMAVRRSAIVRVGGFDEMLGPGAKLRAAEDHDLFDRLLLEGFTGAYEPRIRAEHEQWRSRLALVRLDFAYGTGAGARVVKLLRLGSMSGRRDARHRAGEVAKTFLWALGLRRAWRGARKRHEFGILFGLAKFAGTIRGVVAALFLRVENGHFVPRFRHR